MARGTRIRERQEYPNKRFDDDLECKVVKTSSSIASKQQESSVQVQSLTVDKEEENNKIQSSRLAVTSIAVEEKCVYQAPISLTHRTVSDYIGKIDFYWTIPDFLTHPP